MSDFVDAFAASPQPDSWRENVAAIIMDAAGRVLLGLGRGANAYWHCPQGGVSGKETLEDALQRELREEVGLQPHQYRIITSYGGLRYRYRKSNDKSARWRGQEQTWFLLLCHEEMPPVDCSATDEFATLTWVPWHQLDEELFAPFKRLVMNRVLATFFPEQVQDVVTHCKQHLTTRRYRWGGQQLATCNPADAALFAGGKDEMVAMMARLALRLRAEQKKHAARAGRLLVMVHGTVGSGRRQCLRRLAALADPLGLHHVGMADAFAPGMPWQLLESLPPAGCISLILHTEGHACQSPQDWGALECWLAGQGIRLLKLFLHSSPSGGGGDAVVESGTSALLAATHTDEAPWYVIPADCRWYRDFVVASLMVEALGA